MYVSSIAGFGVEQEGEQYSGGQSANQPRNALETTSSLPVQLCYTHQYHMDHNKLP